MRNYFLILFISFPLSGFCKIYDYEFMCKDKKGQLVEDSNFKECNLKLGCLEEGFKILLTCNQNKNFFGPNSKIESPFENIVSVKFDSRTIFYTTVERNKGKMTSRIRSVEPSGPDVVPLWKNKMIKHDGILKFNKTGEVFFYFEDKSCNSSLDHASKCHKMEKVNLIL